jgi:ABC-2 type transport system ATP-binding protein
VRPSPRRNVSCVDLLVDARKADAVTIEVLDLTKSYGDKEVLRGISFAVHPGQVLGLLGRNGAGKSTTVRILSTLTLPSGGTALVAGFDVVRQPAAVRRLIGVTMQDAALDEYATAREHLRLIAGLWGQSKSHARQRTDELLEIFGLAGSADRLVTTFSGGMRRRLDIATALLQDPKVLYLDEPTTGLDPQSRRALWQQIEALRSRGAAILMTTQYLAEAEELADTVAVLHDGHLVAYSPPDELVAELSRTVVDVHLEDASQAGLLTTSAEPALVTAVGERGRHRLELPASSVATDALELLSRVQQRGVVVNDVRVTPPSLEDAYLRLTGTTIEHGQEQ